MTRSDAPSHPISQDNWESLKGIVQRLIIENKELKEDVDKLKRENDIVKNDIDEITKHIFTTGRNVRGSVSNNVDKNTKNIFPEHETKFNKEANSSVKRTRIIETDFTRNIAQENDMTIIEEALENQIQQPTNKLPGTNFHEIENSFIADDIENIEYSDSNDSSDEYFDAKEFTSSLISRRMSIFSSKSTREEVSNTETIHMYSISMAYLCAMNPSVWKRTWSWITALFSFFTIWMQIIIINSLVNDASTPHCSMHDDCQRGMFCDGFDTYNISRRPKCLDCTVMNWSDQCDVNVSDKEWEDLAGSMWFNKDFEPSIDIPASSLSMNVSSVDYDHLAKCATKQYCIENVISGDYADASCKHLEVNLAQFDAQTIMVLFFVCILFASCMHEDMKQSDIERKLLSIAESELPNDISMPQSTHLIHINLMLSRFGVPISNVAAGIGILISQRITAPNIVLNLIAILFVNEADDLLAALFLSSKQHVVGDNLLQRAINRNEGSISFLGSKINAIFLSIVLGASCLYAEIILELFGRNEKCESISSAILSLAGFTLFFVVIAGRITWMYVFCKETHKNARIFLEFFRLNTAYFIIIEILTIADLMEFTAMNSFKYYPPLPVAVGLVGNFCTGLRPTYILDKNVQRSMMNYIIDTIVAIFWMSTHFFALYAMISANT